MVCVRLMQRRKTILEYSYYHNYYFTARRYASALYAMVLCLSVCRCLTQVGVLSKRMNESSWFLEWQFLSTYPAL